MGSNVDPTAHSHSHSHDNAVAESKPLSRASALKKKLVRAATECQVDILKQWNSLQLWDSDGAENYYDGPGPSGTEKDNYYISDSYEVTTVDNYHNNSNCTSHSLSANTNGSSKPSSLGVDTPGQTLTAGKSGKRGSLVRRVTAM